MNLFTFFHIETVKPSTCQIRLKGFDVTVKIF